MAELLRIRCAWQGWNGGPGVTTFYATGTDPSPALTALVPFWTGFKASIPAPITITVPGSGDIIDEASGSLTGQWQHGADQVITCTGGGTWTSGAGLMIKFHTAQIHNGRRLQGRVFVVPTIAADFNSSGMVDPSVAATLQTSVNNLISGAANTLAVWGRPKLHAGGLHGQITDGIISPKPALLRSRRD